MILNTTLQRMSAPAFAMRWLIGCLLAIAAVAVVAQTDDSANAEQGSTEVASTEQQTTESTAIARKEPFERSVDRPIEEITVRAEQTVMAIRYQLRSAQDEMFAKFNELNSNDEFDIKCRNVRHAGSHIPRRECEPRFFTRERQSNSIQVISQMRDDGAPSGGGLGGASVAGAGGSGVATSLNFDAIEDYKQDDSELRSVLGAKYEALDQEMLRIAMENPEFLQSLMRVDAFRKALVEALEQPR